MPGRLLLVFSGAVKAGAAAVLAGIVFALAPPAHAATAPRLVDQNGRVFTLGALRGRPLVVTFVAATCTQACPLINAMFARAQQAFAQQHLDARLLTITLEPEKDTPAVMRGLAFKFGADPKRWIVASGRVADVRAIVRAFGVRTGDEHTTFVYVFDRSGTLREQMLASTGLDQQLAAHLRILARGTRR